MAAHWLGHVSSLATAVALLAVAAAGGWRVAGVLLPAAEGRGLRLLVACALGVGALSYLTLAVGLAGFVSAGAGFAVVAAVLALGARDLRTALAAPAASAAGPRPALGPLAAAAGGCAALALLVPLVGALAPPMYYDPLVYHFSVPKLHLLRGAVAYVPENVHAQYPSTLQMLNLLALEVNDDIAAQLLHYGLGLLLAAAVYLFGRRFASAAAGAWAAVFLVTTPAVAMTFFRGMIDPGVALFLFLAFFALAVWDDGGARQRRLLLLAGLLGGLGISSKYTAVWLWGVLAAAVPLVARRRGAPWRRALGDLAAVALPSAAVLAPWLAKTWLATGNPVFPFLYGIFGGRNWTAEAAARLAAYNAGMGGHIGWGNFWRLPYEMFLGRGALENMSLGPFWLLGLPLALGGGRRPRAVALAGAAALLYLPYWLVTARILRYLVLVAPLAAVVYGERFAALPARSGRRALAGALVLLAAAANLRLLAVDGIGVFQPVRVALGLEGREEYLSRMLAAYPVQAWASRELPAGARVLFVGETRAYHLERDHVANSAHDPQIIVDVVRGAADGEGVVAALRARGITHVLWNPSEMDRLERQYGTFGWRPGERERLAAAMRRGLRPLVSSRGVTLFAVREPGAGAR